MDRRKFLLGLGTAGLVSALPNIAAADCPAKKATGCVLVPAPNHKTLGTLEQELEHWAWLCHPDYAHLKKPRWWSYVMVTDKSYSAAVQRVLDNPKSPLPDEVEVQGQECRQQWFKPGWRALAVTNCRREDRRWTFLLSRPLTAEDHGRPLAYNDWQDLEPVFDL